MVTRRWASVGNSVVWMLLVAAVVWTAPLLMERHGAESDARAVLLVVDGEEARTLALRADATLPEEVAVPRLYGLWKEAGAQGVGLYEWTVADAVDRGFVFTHTAASLHALSSPLAPMVSPDDLDFVYVTVADPRALPSALPSHPWVTARIQDVFSTPVATAVPVEDVFPGRYVWRIDRRHWDVIADVPLGFYPPDVQQIIDASLYVVPRLRSSVGAFPPRAEERLAGLHTAGSRGLLGPMLFVGVDLDFLSPAGRELLQFLPDLGVPLGLIEFTTQRHIADAARALGYNAIPVHGITEREMAAQRVDEPTAVARFLRALRERGVQVAYVRLFDMAPLHGGFLTNDVAELFGVDPSHAFPSDAEPALSEDNDEWVQRVVARNAAYIGQLATAFREAGFATGTVGSLISHGAFPSQPPLYGLVLVAAAIGAMGGCVMSQAMGRWPTAWPFVGALAVAAIFVALWLKGHTVLARQLAAFGANGVFPVAGWMVASRYVSRPAGGGRSAALVRAAVAFVLASGVTLIGAAFVALYVYEPRFWLKLALFRGVKLIHVLPPLLVGLLAFAGQHDPRSRSRAFENSRTRPWRRLWHWEWHVKVKVGQLAFLALGCLLIAGIVLRTGNEGLPVWQGEHVFREFLEQTLVVRPRTKEMLLGHPALFIGLFLAASASNRRGDGGESGVEPTSRGTVTSWLIPAFMAAGVIGQLSIINTFAHAHSPLAVSVIRTFSGLGLGALFGIIGACVVEAWRAARKGRGRA